MILFKEFLKWKNIVIFLITNAFIVFLICFLGIILSVQEFGFSLFQWADFFFIAVQLTYFYQKYNNPILLDRLKVENQSKFRLQILLFLIILFWTIIFINLWLLWIYLLDTVLGWVGGTNIAGTHFHPFSWENFYFGAYYYYALTTSIIIIVFLYFLNHFIKNKNILYLVIIVISLYLFLFSDIFLYNYSFREVTYKGQDQYMIFWQANGDILRGRLFINNLLFPWTTQVIWAKSLFNISNFKEGVPINWFNSINLTQSGYWYDNFYKYINFYWPIYIMFYLITSKLHSKLLESE